MEKSEHLIIAIYIMCYIQNHAVGMEASPSLSNLCGQYEIVVNNHLKVHFNCINILIFFCKRS